MKRIFLSLFLILAFSTKVFAGDYYFIGVDAFKKGVYDKAALNLEHAIKINPRNVNARYYLAQAYLMQKRNSDAKNQYNRIIILAPTSDAAMLSQKGLFLIRQSELGGKAVTAGALSNDLAMYRDNYLDYVLTGGEIKKWAIFPITVYIEPKKQKAATQKAFEQWQAKSNNLVSFRFVNTPANTQITVDFKGKLESSSGDKNYIAGFSKPYCKGNYITNSEIHLLAVDPDTKQQLADDFITFAALHEIGHSLGFKGHSPNENDIMAATAKTAKTELTQRDINTLNVFYKVSQKTLFARNKGQTDVQLQQALDYVKQIPDKAVGWTNLGDIYRSKKMYSEAIKNYQKSISIEPWKAETYNLIGSTYAEMGDSQNAFVNLKKACDLEKTNSFYLYEFAKLCLNTGQKELGKNYINIYLQVNPQGQFDEKIQSLLRLYK